MALSEPIGVVPYAPGLRSPADRRRMGCWARSRDRLLDLETPHLQRVVVINPLCDLNAWTAWRRQSSSRRLVVDVVDYRYLRDALEPGSGLASLTRDYGRTWLYGAGPSKVPITRFSTRLRIALKTADAITCSSPEHAAYLGRFGLEGTPIIDCHEEIPPLEPRFSTRPQPLRLLWEGQLATLPFVNELGQGLTDLTKETRVDLVLCTDLKGYRYANRFGRISPEQVLRPLQGIRGLTISVEPWSAQGLASLAETVDAAVLPVSAKDRVAWLKAENRALIMWRLGLPVLMSATPAYARVARSAGVDGLVAATSDWDPSLRRVIDDEWRYHQSSLGQEFVNRSHDPETVHAKWDELLDRL